VSCCGESTNAAATLPSRSLASRGGEHLQNDSKNIVFTKKKMRSSLRAAPRSPDPIIPDCWYLPHFSVAPTPLEEGLVAISFFLSFFLSFFGDTKKIREANKKNRNFFFPQWLSASGGGDNTVVDGHHYQNLHQHILREPASSQALPSPRLCSLMWDAPLYICCLYSVVACFQ